MTEDVGLWDCVHCPCVLSSFGFFSLPEQLHTSLPSRDFVIVCGVVGLWLAESENKCVVFLRLRPYSMHDYISRFAECELELIANFGLRLWRTAD